MLDIIQHFTYKRERREEEKNNLGNALFLSSAPVVTAFGD
jgi:hypothetical protein